MSERTEGTIVLDGLIEGRLPDDPSIEQKLEQWLQFVGELGLRFNLEVSGSSFSLLPESTATPVSKIGEPPDRALKEAMEQLFQAFPAAARQQVFSTLRSVEYRPGEEVQTLYAALPDGTVRTEQRRVEAQTAAAPKPMTTGERLRMAAFVGAVVLAVFGVSTFFVDWGGIFGQFVATVTPVSPDELQVQAEGFEDMLVIAGKAASGNPKGVTLTLKRGALFPIDEATAAKAMAGRGGSIERKLAVESVIRGYLLVELFDTEGKFIRTGRIRIIPLFEREQLDVVIPFPERTKVSRIAIRY